MEEKLNCIQQKLNGLKKGNSMLSRDQFLKMKQNGDKITMMTAYDYPSAKTVEAANIDMILVGDSLGNVVLGYESTIEVTLDDMIHHASAVRRGADDTFIVVDMPFMTYNISIEDSLRNARRLFQQTKAHTLKLEGASQEVLELTSRLTEAGIPVVLHIGLQPQSVHVLGGYKVQGKSEESRKQLISDAKNAEKYGAMGVVLECIPKDLAKEITEIVQIPTIGIGSGVHCDGQVLVYHDVLLYGSERTPKFVKSYSDLNQITMDAIKDYITDVKEKAFPSDEHSYLK